jgi:5-methylcytosine-specific restriction endonuclease McrA
MKKSFRTRYPWTFEDYCNEFKSLGYTNEHRICWYAKNLQRITANLAGRDFRKKYFTQDTVCKCCLSKDKLQVDHIVPIFFGGKNEESNLQFLCKPCHNKKTKEDYWKYSSKIKKNIP